MKGLEWRVQIRLLFKLIALSVQVVHWNQRTLYIYSLAIRVLEQQGLVEVIPKNGTYVTSFDSDKIKDGLHVRVALEQLALKQSIERLSNSEWRKHCDHLQDLVDQMLKAAEDFDVEKDAELDIDWHTAIIDASRNQNLSRTWRLTGLSHFIWSIEYRLYPLNQNDLLSHHERHQKLLDVFIEKNPEKCAKELQHYILRKNQDIDF
ncbi:MAG: GntR family transcriptional regulator [SAR324 cluster bacterium]|nr:GntR family transcriptional regulator [SAR324 cluster bacterium]